jgi:vacuolar protein sorting-associated protein 13A/C
LIIDAGHIAVESELADQKVIKDMQAKRSQQFSDEDYRHLESLMYDKFSLKLTDAQVSTGFKC